MRLDCATSNTSNIIPVVLRVDGLVDLLLPKKAISPPEMYKILYVIINFSSVIANNIWPCDFELSVNINDGMHQKDRIIKDGISYNRANYFVLEDEIRGCPCNMKRCIRKCCKMDEEVANKTCARSNPEHLTRSLTEMYPSFFFVFSFLNCSQRNRFLLSPDMYGEQDHFFINRDGYLVHGGIAFSQSDYCVDYFSGDSLSALKCDKDVRPEKYSVGMIISMPFLLVTFIVYALIPERNLPAKALMCYVLSLLFAYVFLVTIQLHSSFEPLACATVGLLCYFFFMVSFFWMNSSCIDIWLTFSGIRGLTGSKKHDTRRFLYYSAYAWGVPLLLVCLVIGLSYGSSVDRKSLYHPGIGNGQCWFGNGMPTFIYFYLPIAILLTTNIVLFCVTAYKIQMVRNDTAMLRRDDSQKSRLESDKQRFNLYVKLLLAMGINWTMEVISWALDWKFSSIPTEVWYLTDFCNALYGVFIFFIFVFKRNIWVMLKKRYLTFTGKPHLAHSLGTSTTRTTVSHVTSEA